MAQAGDADLSSFIYVGLCEFEISTPYVDSELVACAEKGCSHRVWCDKALREIRARTVKVLCVHCVEAKLPRRAA